MITGSLDINVLAFVGGFISIGAVVGLSLGLASIGQGLIAIAIALKDGKP